MRKNIRKIYNLTYIAAVCGIPNSPQNRIVGGWEADVNGMSFILFEIFVYCLKIQQLIQMLRLEFPWMCALFISGGSFCSCSLIGDQWIVTAAHCADG